MTVLVNAEKVWTRKVGLFANGKTMDLLRINKKVGGFFGFFLSKREEVCLPLLAFPTERPKHKRQENCRKWVSKPRV